VETWCRSARPFSVPRGEHVKRGVLGNTYRVEFAQTYGLPASPPVTVDVTESDEAREVDTVDLLRLYRKGHTRSDVIIRDTVIVNAGWPWSALRGLLTRRSSVGGGKAQDPWESRGVIVIRESPPFEMYPWGYWIDRFKPVPFGPIWHGLVGNTCVFGAASWGITAFWNATRCRGRSARRRCTKCKYNRAGLAVGAVCPECGEGGLS
jgi:hypothetical protein